MKKLINLSAKFSPKSIELWTFVTWLFCRTKTKLEIDDLENISSLHKSNYYLWDSYRISILNNLNHEKSIRENVTDTSMVLAISKLLPGASANCLISSLILTYDKGLESLWNAKRYLVANTDDYDLKSDLLFIRKLLDSKASKTQLNHILSFITYLQTDLSSKLPESDRVST